MLKVRGSRVRQTACTQVQGHAVLRTHLASVARSLLAKVASRGSRRGLTGGGACGLPGAGERLVERLVLKSTGASPVKRFMPSLSARADSLDVEATPSFVSLAMSGCWPLVLLKA